MLGISTTNLRVNGFRGGIDADAKAIYNRIIADSGVSNLSRLNYLVKGLKTIYGSLSNTPVCYDAHWIGYQPANGVGATSGQACAKLYSLTVAGDAVQATASQQPLLLAHNGAVTDNYWYGSGVAGNYVSTPNAAANQITGDIEIIAKIEGVFNLGQRIINKRGVGANYDLYISDTSATQLTCYFGATIGTADCPTSFTMQSGGIWIKMTRIAATGVVQYYTSTNGITFTTLGASINTTAGNLVTTTDVLYIGVYGYANVRFFQGKIYRATISNSIGGTPVVDFNPASYNAATSQTQWTSATSEVWTINTGTATTGYKGVLVDRTIVQSDGVDDRILGGTITAVTNRTNYVSAKSLGGTDNYLFGGSTVLGNDVLVQSSQNRLVWYPDGNGLIFGTSLVYNSLFYIRTQANATTKAAQMNTATPQTDTVGTLASLSDIKLFVAGNGNGYKNAIINTFILSNTYDNSTTNTAMYNFLKTLNNNSF